MPNYVQLNKIGEQFHGLPRGGQQSRRPRYALAWHSTLTPNMTNEVRFRFSSSTPTFFNREKFHVGYRLTLPPNAQGTQYIPNPIQTFLQQARATSNHHL